MIDTSLLFALLALAVVASVGLLLRRRQRAARHREAQAADEAARVAREQARLLEAERLVAERAAAERAQTRQQRAEKQAEQQTRERSAALAARQQAERDSAAQALAAREAAAALQAAQAAAKREAEAAAARERVAAQAEAARLAAEQAEQAAAAEATAVRSTEPPPEALPSRARTAAETLVMVADDSKVVRVKTSRLLAQHHYRVVLAEDGLEAMRLIEAEVPHVLVTDVEMPGLDGFALTRHVRGQASTAQIPIIMITSADDRLKAAAAEAGVTLVLGKPYPEEELLACIQRAQALCPVPEAAAA